MLKVYISHNDNPVIGGVRSCTRWKDYNNLLESFGDEAYENAAVPIVDEDKYHGISMM